jgi:hypothetical protein
MEQRHPNWLMTTMSIRKRYPEQRDNSGWCIVGENFNITTNTCKTNSLISSAPAPNQESMNLHVQSVSVILRLTFAPVVVVPVRMSSRAADFAQTPVA